MDFVEKARREKRVGSYPPDDHRWVDTFWDLGVDDATAIWFRQIDGGRQVWVDYHEENGKDIAHYIKILQDKGYNFRTHYLPHDGGQRSIQTGVEASEIFRQCCKQAGISDDVVVCPKLPVQDGINGVRKQFSKFYFNEGLCEDGIRKLELYHRRYDDKRRTFVKEPVHDWTSHCADALRTVIAAEEYEDRQSSPQPLTIHTNYDILD
jgi:hypothetical protein